MAYYGSIRITDVNGNVVELNDTTELLEDIRDELKLIRLQLEEMSENKIDKEDLDGH